MTSTHAAASSACIHPTAIIEPGAELGAGVEVGADSIVGGKVQLGDGVRIHSHVVLAGRTVVGAGTEIFPFASIGHIPQDKKFGGEESRLIIGEQNVIREQVTMNPGTRDGGMVTEVGSHGLYMVGSHVAHDCRVGDHVILANNATLAGHCTVGDHAILGGLSAVHQFVRIGDHAFVGGMSGVEQDVIPFGMVLGNRASLAGLNIIGLKRLKFDREQIHNLRQAYRLLFSAEGTLAERLDDVDRLFANDVGVQRIVTFVRAESSRSLCVPRA
jgi:UDP-N-acetylglucosamine acyltransferase